MQEKLDKLKIDLQKELESDEIIVDDITFEKKRKLQFLNNYSR